MSALKNQLPPDFIMRELTKVAVETVTSDIAAKARAFAKTLTPEITGAAALEAFANAIDSTNSKLYGTSEMSDVQ